MTLKIDLHTHTYRYSQCSGVSPEDLCETALACGLDALAITEHHYQWSKDEIDELQSHYPALKLYAGVEISCTDKHDYVVLGLDPESYPKSLPTVRLQSLLDAHPEAFAFVAHCFRFSTGERGLSERAIDGIEIGSYNTLARLQLLIGRAMIAHEALYRRWQRRMGWIALYNSDAHSAAMMGTFYNMVDAPSGMPDSIPDDERALAHCLRQAQIRPFADQARIRAAIRDG